MRTDLTRNETAEVGISSLIIFMTAIMVAGLTAGLLSNLVGDFEDRAREAGEQASSDSSSGLLVEGVVGDRGVIGDPSAPLQGDIQVLEIRVSLLPASDAIDLRDTVIQVTDGNAMMDVGLDASSSSATDTSSSLYVAAAIRDLDDSMVSSMMTGDDLVKIIVNTNATETGLSIGPGTEVIVHIYPPIGGRTTIRTTSPDTYFTRYVELI